MEAAAHTTAAHATQCGKALTARKRYARLARLLQAAVPPTRSAQGAAHVTAAVAPARARRATPATTVAAHPAQMIAQVTANAQALELTEA